MLIRNDQSIVWVDQTGRVVKEHKSDRQRLVDQMSEDVRLAFTLMEKPNRYIEVIRDR